MVLLCFVDIICKQAYYEYIALKFDTLLFHNLLPSWNIVHELYNNTSTQLLIHIPAIII